MSQRKVGLLIYPTKLCLSLTLNPTLLTDADLLLVMDQQSSDCDTRWSQQLSGLPPKLLQRLMPFQRHGVEFALSKSGR
ncbi:hypothetical protein ATANTOWER_018265, partial [Ataeniobius toweri]|nr:hypothetical protein [Ataeniobius toweri]